MRKLTDPESAALIALRKFGSYCPGNDIGPDINRDYFLKQMRSLVKKGHVRIEMTDDGPRYHAA